MALRALVKTDVAKAVDRNSVSQLYRYIFETNISRKNSVLNFQLPNFFCLGQSSRNFPAFWSFTMWICLWRLLRPPFNIILESMVILKMESKLKFLQNLCCSASFSTLFPIQFQQLINALFFAVLLVCWWQRGIWSWRRLSCNGSRRPTYCVFSRWEPQPYCMLYFQDVSLVLFRVFLPTLYMTTKSHCPNTHPRT